MPTHPEFLHVSDAAKCLGVTVGTVRNWIKASKLRAKRHPVNRYRMILKSDIMALAREIQAPPKMTPSSGQRAPKKHRA